MVRARGNLEERLIMGVIVGLVGQGWREVYATLALMPHRGAYVGSPAGSTYNCARIHRLWAQVLPEIGARKFPDGREHLNSFLAGRSPASTQQIAELVNGLAAQSGTILRPAAVAAARGL